MATFSVPVGTVYSETQMAKMDQGARQWVEKDLGATTARDVTMPRYAPEDMSPTRTWTMAASDLNIVRLNPIDAPWTVTFPSGAVVTDPGYVAKAKPGEEPFLSDADQAKQTAADEARAAALADQKQSNNARKSQARRDAIRTATALRTLADRIHEELAIEPGPGKRIAAALRKQSDWLRHRTEVSEAPAYSVSEAWTMIGAVYAARLTGPVSAVEADALVAWCEGWVK